jgi:hypothetical protein
VDRPEYLHHDAEAQRSLHPVSFVVSIIYASFRSMKAGLREKASRKLFSACSVISKRYLPTLGLLRGVELLASTPVATTQYFLTTAGPLPIRQEYTSIRAALASRKPPNQHSALGLS